MSPEAAKRAMNAKATVVGIEMDRQVRGTIVEIDEDQDGTVLAGIVERGQAAAYYDVMDVELV